MELRNATWTQESGSHRKAPADQQMLRQVLHGLRTLPLPAPVVPGPSWTLNIAPEGTWWYQAIVAQDQVVTSQAAQTMVEELERLDKLAQSDLR